MRLVIAILLTALLAATALADCPNLYVSQFGATGSGAGQLNSPQRCATDRAGNVYVVDTGNHRIQKFSPGGTWLASLGSLGSAAGQFNNPRGVAVDSVGNVYVMDTNNNRIQKFNASLAWLWSAGSLGSGAGQMNGAQGIAVDPTGTFVYVAEYSNGRISRFTSSGVYSISWASASVSDVAVDLAGNVYATSYINNRVTKYTSAGAQLTFWGSAGTGSGQFGGPQGVTVDRYGNVYVTDSGNRRVQKFSTAGVFLAAFGSSGTGAGQFSDIFGIAVDTTGVVWVPDPAANHMNKWGAVPIKVTLSSSANPTTHGQAYNLVARTAPTGATGQVEFRIGAALDGSAPLISGAATLTKSLTSPAGSFDYVAQYVGSGACGGPSSPVLTQVVNKAPTFLHLNVTPNPAGIGQAIRLNAQFYNLTGGPITGAVQFQVNGSPSGTPAPILGALITSTLTRNVTGTWTITASYPGDANFLPCQSSSAELRVIPNVIMPGEVLTIGSFGGTPGAFQYLRGMAIDGEDNVWAVDYTLGRIQEFRRTGALARWFQTATANPRGIAVGPEGHVYVGHGAQAIEMYSNTGALLTTWTSTAGVYLGTDALAADMNGNVHVADATLGLVDAFSSNGVFIAPDVAGSLIGRPTGIATSKAGQLFVSDALNEKILWTAEGFGSAEFACPGDLSGVAVDHAGNVYVAMGAQNKIRRFTWWGALVGEIPTTGSPTALAIDGSDALYAAFPGSQVIKKYVVPPVISSIRDVPGDQGRAVRLKFTPSGSDFLTASYPITGYQVYRQIPTAPVGAAQAQREGIAAPNGAMLSGYDYVLTVPATGDTVYNVIAPTLADSSTTGTWAEIFIVRAVTATPGLLYDSAPASGWSVDNLPPAMPAPFTAAYTGGATHLHWAPSSASDFWHYRLYRGLSPSFVPNPGSLVAAPGDTGYVDTGAAGSFYKLTAVDVNGNESPAALVSPNGTTGVTEGGSLAFALERVHPNPVRGGALRVQCSLARDDRAVVELLDVAGRVVVSREIAGAGPHDVSLDGGRRLAPGLYLLRLAQAGQSRTQRVVVLD